MKNKKTFKSRVYQKTVEQGVEFEGEKSTFVENEHVPGYTDQKLPTRHYFNNGNFITIFQKAMYNISKLANLSKEEYKILLYLLGTAGIDNSICIDLNILSSELTMAKANVSRGLKGLVLRNIVLRKDGYRYGNNPLPFELSLNYDQINYDLAYNGKIKEYKQNRINHPTLEPTPLLEKNNIKQLDLIEEINKIENEKG